MANGVTGGYNYKGDVADAGCLVDLSETDRVTRQSGETSATIGFGFGVVQGATEEKAILPTGTTNKFLGVAIKRQKGAAGYKPGEVFTVVREGLIWVPVEQDVVLGDDAFVRVANTSETTLVVGHFRKTDSSTAANTMKVTNAEFAGASVTLRSGAKIAPLRLGARTSLVTAS